MTNSQRCLKKNQCSFKCLIVLFFFHIQSTIIKKCVSIAILMQTMGKVFASKKSVKLSDLNCWLR